MIKRSTPDMILAFRYFKEENKGDFSPDFEETNRICMSHLDSDIAEVIKRITDDGFVLDDCFEDVDIVTLSAHNASAGTQSRLNLLIQEHAAINALVDNVEETSTRKATHHLYISKSHYMAILREIIALNDWLFEEAIELQRQSVPGILQNNVFQLKRR